MICIVVLITKHKDHNILRYLNYKLVQVMPENSILLGLCQSTTLFHESPYDSHATAGSTGESPKSNFYLVLRSSRVIARKISIIKQGF